MCQSSSLESLAFSLCSACSLVGRSQPERGGSRFRRAAMVSHDQIAFPLEFSKDPRPLITLMSGKPWVSSAMHSTFTQLTSCLSLYPNLYYVLPTSPHPHAMPCCQFLANVVLMGGEVPQGSELLVADGCWGRENRFPLGMSVLVNFPRLGRWSHNLGLGLLMVTRTITNGAWSWKGDEVESTWGRCRCREVALEECDQNTFYKCMNFQRINF